MVRFLLEALLALSLILNGISAPWAMARMAHGEHETCSTHGHEASEQSIAGAEAVADHHAHHHDVGAAGAPASQVPHASKGGACCDGTVCQCGCVLPPALSIAFAPLIAQVMDAAAPAVSPIHIVAAHDAPPLRPPAA
jgi:hypothetical protein